MECNKEEAIRAKVIAEKKMQCKDFSGARKIVLKAQQLFPDLENISQMLTVCEVHCSAAMKVNGSEDWYGILQVERTADESSIKKQYRKLALLLHPDKNKFAGAEAAFKLIGEAHRTLSDQAKRSVYDMKIRLSVRTVVPKQQPNRAHPVKTQPGFKDNSTIHANMQFTGLNQQQTQVGAQAFWTVCPFCEMKYQYYRSVLNKALRCQSCSQPFIAHEISSQIPPGAKSGYFWNSSSIPQCKEFPGQGVTNAGWQSNFGNASCSTGFQGNVGGGPAVSAPSSKMGTNAEVGGGSKNKAKEEIKTDKEAGKDHELKFEKVKLEELQKKEQAVKSAVNPSRKRSKKMVVDSSDTESTDSEEVIIEEADHPAGQNSGTANSRYPRRSSRLKQNVTYNEDGSGDDDFVSPLKRLRKGESSRDADRKDNAFSGGDANEVRMPASETAVSKDKKQGKSNGSISLEENLQNGDKQADKFKGNLRGNLPNGASSKADSSATQPKPEEFSYPDPEFFDFEKERHASKFEVGQIWTVYDNVDGMPRFYALIKNVLSPNFNLQFTWLESDPLGKAERDWSDEDLPIACGNFKMGKTENTQDHLMFSHLVHMRKGKKKKSYEIYPREGEVWAIYKGWNINWSSDPDNHRHYDYEIVEVLSNYADGIGVSIVHLVKVKGFVSLFCRAVNEGAVPVQIQPNEMLRFSHMIPAYRMTGGERDGIPKGSYELDAVSLPTNFEEIFPSVSLDEIKVRVAEIGVKNYGQCSESATEEEKLANEVENSKTLKKENVELNENIGKEQHLKSRNLPKGVNGAHDRKCNQSTTSQSTAIEAENNAGGERMTSKCSIDKNDEHFGSPDSSSSSSAEYHDDSLQASANPMVYEYPDSEFYSFESERCRGNFQVGQIWALYCDIDGFPKYYAVIRKVDLADFKVHVIWLEACPVLEEEIQWSEEDLPISCGRFKVQSGRKAMQTYDTIDTFSHLVLAEKIGTKPLYDIYPCVGEVWAVYKNWIVGWKLSNLENCEYDLVEVLVNDGSVIKVMVLAKEDGFKAVFKAAVTMEITRKEWLRFSHKIPAFRLTDQRGGKLRGYWELDTASVPEVILCTSSG